MREIIIKITTYNEKKHRRSSRNNKKPARLSVSLGRDNEMLVRNAAR